MQPLPQPCMSGPICRGRSPESRGSGAAPGERAGHWHWPPDSPSALPILQCGGAGCSAQQLGLQLRSCGSNKGPLLLAGCRTQASPWRRLPLTATPRRPQLTHTDFTKLAPASPQQFDPAACTPKAQSQRKPSLSVGGQQGRGRGKFLGRYCRLLALFGLYISNCDAAIQPASRDPPGFVQFCVLPST